MSLSLPKGTYDVLPLVTDPKEAWRATALWHFFEKIVRNHTRLYGFEEIRTPIFERIEVFQRGVGEDTDIVMKEMFVFQDKAERTMVLRPEGTSAVMRAFIEKKLHTLSPVHRLYYMGPMFRYERPQAGRYRQHIQFGAEIIGNSSPEQDAEAIAFLYTLYEKIGLKDLTLYINSIGDKESRHAYRTALRRYLDPFRAELSPDSQIRLETNPLRILDSKDPQDQQLLKEAPVLKDYLSQDARSHHEKLKELLSLLAIPFAEEQKLVRGLDYYTKTVFEITSGKLGAQNTVGAGGRYDGLIKTLGGPDLPAVGFATGVERILQTLLSQEIPVPESQGPLLYLVPLGDSAKNTCLQLMQQTRALGLSAQMDMSGKKVKDALRHADQLKATYTIVIGDNELKSGIVSLKHMQSHTATETTLADLHKTLQRTGP